MAEKWYRYIGITEQTILDFMTASLYDVHCGWTVGFLLVTQSPVEKFSKALESFHVYIVHSIAPKKSFYKFCTTIYVSC